MAELVALTAAHSPDARSVRLVPLEKIDATGRLRPVDSDWAEALAVSIARDGLITPIELRPLPGGKLKLVAGAHRLAAMALLDLREVPAFVRDQPQLEARAREIAENVMRRELSPLDRAAFVTELYEVEKARAGWEESESKQSFGARKRWAKDASAMFAEASGLPEAVALKVGLSPRAIRYDLELLRGLNPAARAKIAGLPVAENAAALRLLARQSPSDQVKIAGMLAEGGVKTVALALEALRPKTRADAESKAWSAFFGGWSRMGARERRQALRNLAAGHGGGLPTGVTLTFADEAGRGA